MPYYPQQGTPLIPALAGAAATYFDTQQQMKDAELQRQQVQQQMTQAAAMAPLQQQYMQSQIDTEKTTADRNKADTAATQEAVQEAIKRSKIIPPVGLLQMLDTTDPYSPQHVKALDTLSSYFFQHGDPTTADTILSHADTIGASMYRTFEDPQIQAARTAATVAAYIQEMPYRVSGAEQEQLYRSQHPSVSSRSRGGPTFSTVNSMLNEYTKGPYTQIGTTTDYGTGDKTPVYGYQPPRADVSNWVTSAVDAIQQSGNPSQAAATAEKKYRHTWGKNVDPKVIRILHAAGSASPDADTSGVSDDTSNPPNVPDSFQNP